METNIHEQMYIGKDRISCEERYVTSVDASNLMHRNKILISYRLKCICRVSESTMYS